MTLPPGPRRPAIAQLAEWLFRPTAFMDECAQRFGDVFTLRFPGIGTSVFVHSHEHNKQLFTGDPSVLHAGEASNILRFVLGSSSVILLDGAEHLRQRRLLLPPFHGERMQTYARQMHEITRAQVARWPIGEPFPMLPELQAIGLHIILRSVFGVEEGAQMGELAGLLTELVAVGASPLLFLIPLQRDFRLNPYHRYFEVQRAVDARLHEIIRARRRAGDLASRSDILSLLMLARDEDGRPMTDAELRDELLTLLLAGHDTSANGTAWALSLLLSSPEVLEKTVAELRSATSVGGAIDPVAFTRLEYLDAVIRESLRLRNVTPIVVRRLKARWEIGGYQLPIGTVVAACIYLTHRRPDLYPAPDSFSPERFVGRKIDPYAWMPFGGGVRRCIGMAFALFEMKVILATVLTEARLRLASSTPERVRRRGVILSPADGMRVLLTERLKPSTPPEATAHATA